MAKLAKKTPSAVKKTAPKGKGNQGAVRSSRDLTLKRFQIVVQGGRGSGKSILAATASKYWPTQIPTKNGVTLEDLLYIAFDVGATDGLAEMGIDVPVLDVNMLIADPDTWKSAGMMKAPSIMQAMQYAMKTASERVQAGETDIVIVDTISTMGHKLHGHFDRIATDGWELYRNLLSAHELFHSTITSHCPKVIFLTHSKALAEASDKNQKNRRKATLSPGMPEIVPRIAGSGGDIYIDNSSLELVIIAKKGMGKAGLERVVYPISHGDANSHETKNRFALSLNETEPPHLGEIFAKIEKNVRRK